MAPESGKPKSESELNTDEFIRKLVPDPHRVPDATVLFGFLDTRLENVWRLYITPDLTRYIEIPNPDENVIFHRKLDLAQSPLGGSVVVVRGNTTLVLAEMMSREIQANFLRGFIANRFMAGTKDDEPKVPDPITTVLCKVLESRFCESKQPAFCPTTPENTCSVLLC